MWDQSARYDFIAGASDLDSYLRPQPAVPVDLTEVLFTDGAALKGSDSSLSASQSSKPSGGGGSTVWTSSVHGSAYNITIEFKGAWSSDFQTVFKNAANRISTIITGDVPDVRIVGSGGNLRVDDIYITAELKNIDGVGGILGQSGPTAIRIGSDLPAAATMQFDIADAQTYLKAGYFDEIVTHEMLHSVGFGSIWSDLNLTNTSDTLFLGANALHEYEVLKGGAPQAGVPLETGGGAGTAGSHWSEALFKTELMTGYLDAGGATDPLSRMTAASLADLGYTVNLASSAIDQGYVLMA